MSLLVDTSVWSLALRRDVEQSAPEVVALRHALLGTDQVFDRTGPPRAAARLCWAEGPSPAGRSPLSARLPPAS